MAVQQYQRPRDFSMNKQQSNALMQRLLDNIEKKTTDMASDVMVESADVFIDQARWEKERRQFFLDTPQVVGFAGEVASPGSYITATVLDIEIIVCRDDAGDLRAFHNACTHRGAKVADGLGSTSRFNCIFHGWSFSLDGALKGRPQSEQFGASNAELNLRALPVSDKSGLLVVGLHIGISQHDVESHLEEIEAQLQFSGFSNAQSIEERRYEVNANWKLVTGLSHEAYHFNTLHRESLAGVMFPHAIVDFFGQHSRWAFPFKDIQGMKKLDQEDWPPHPLAAVSHTIFPGTVVIVTAGDAQILRAEPGLTPGRSVVTYRGVAFGSSDLDQSKAAYEFGGEVFEAEDLPVAEQCQRAFDTGMKNMLIGKNESIVQFWHKLWEENLGS